MKYKSLIKVKQCVILTILLSCVISVAANKKYAKTFDKVTKKVDGMYPT